MVASTTPAADGRFPSGAPRTLGQTHKQCAWCGLGVDVKTARAIRGAARDPGDLACSHALHASCLRDWQYSGLTPGQRALVDTRRGPRYAKSLRQLALAEYDSCFGGRCAACADAP